MKKAKKAQKRSLEGNTADATPYEKLLKSIDIKQGEAETLIKRYRKANHDQKRTENPEDRPKIQEEEPSMDQNNEEKEEDIAGDETEDSEEELNSDNDGSDEELESKKGGLEDPFKVHFESVITEAAAAQLEEEKPDRRQLLVPGLGTAVCTATKADVPLSSYTSTAEKSCLSSARVKEKLISRWEEINKCGKNKAPFSDLQNSLFNYMNSYQDVLFCQRDFQNGEEIRKLYCLHAVNHILKTRSRILKNNDRIVQAQKEGIEPPELRDQGLTRPKVLILVPFRDCALRIVNLLIQLALPIDQKAQVMKKKRFYDEFKDDSAPEKNPRYTPDDFKTMFQGNTDDCFRIGITVMRRAMKLYADFYSADIIIASPLGLRTIIGAEGDKKRDFDFLSSIELLIVDQADVFLMQNWEHVLDIFDHLNVQPKQPRDTDFSRVRMWTLNSWSKLYRQTLVFSSFLTPEINSIYNKHCLNYAGKVKIKSSSLSGSVKQIVSQIPQIFQRLELQSISEEADKRFQYFIKKVLPEFKGTLNSQTAIFIPSYFDFVRIRNYFKKEELDFAQINEYSERSNISRARTEFFQKKHHFLLFTERFYFFYRYRIRGIKHMIFYQLPLYPVFYSEIVNFMDIYTNSVDASSSMCTILYSKFDSNRLENVTGTQRCKQILTSSKNVHMIVTGD